MIKNILLAVATLGPIGYIRGSGTLATVFTLSLMYLFWFKVSIILQLIIICSLFVCSFPICKYAITHFKKNDPSQVVIDEVIGSLVVFCGISFQVTNLIIGFLLFRFFDISKWAGIKKVELLKDGWGVMLDDVLAGLLSNIILHALSGYLL